MGETPRQKTVVVGAGPVGALAALYAAQRGHDVEIYELRSDLRDPSITPLNFTKSINLALSERGESAIRHSGHRKLIEKIYDTIVPMRGRMIHGKDKAGELYEQSQDYDINGRTLKAADRAVLNKILLDELEPLPNVKFFFNHKLTGADFRNHKAWFEISSPDKPSTGRAREIEIDFDLLIGADGAHSSARYHLMKYARMDYQQEYIDTLWCEFHIDQTSPPVGTPDGIVTNADFAMSSNHLHIWPGKEFMFIAIPSRNGSFTCTLFLPSSHFAALEADPASLPDFFNTHFPGVTDLIPEPLLIHSFTTNPHLPLISIKCSPYHFQDSAVIIGDAAHAMVPFYGQGMNAGLEDITVLFDFLDDHSTSSSSHPYRYLTPSDREKALSQYSAHRAQDAYAINDLALSNYIEMRSSVTSPTYKARKWLEEKLSVWVPSLGWKTQYSRVSFGNERYSDVVRKSERQGKLLLRWLIGGAVGVPVFLAGAVGVWLRFRRGWGMGLGLGLWGH